MARIKETFNSRSWFMIECDDPNCEQRFDDSQWYADEDDLLAAAKDEGWQILYKDEHPELERDMHYCPARRLPECSTCTNIMIDPAGWKDGNAPNASRRRSRMNGHDFTREQNMEARMTLAAARRGLAAAINDAENGIGHLSCDDPKIMEQVRAHWRRLYDTYMNADAIIADLESCARHLTDGDNWEPNPIADGMKPLEMAEELDDDSEEPSAHGPYTRYSLQTVEEVPWKPESGDSTPIHEGNRTVHLPDVRSFGRLERDKWLAVKNLEESAELVEACKQYLKACDPTDPSGIGDQFDDHANCLACYGVNVGGELGDDWDKAKAGWIGHVRDQRRQAMLDELADVLQTVGNLITAFGITDEEVGRAMGDCLERNRRKGRL